MLKTIGEMEQELQAGKAFFIAGEEELLKKLPRGNWIGGTIPYFMAETGGVVTQEKVFATEVPPGTVETSISWYTEKSLPRLPGDSPDNGFTFVIIPATSATHVSFAQNAPEYEGNFLKNLIGWISGVHLNDLGSKAPKVFNGKTGENSAQDTISMHCTLEEGRIPTIGIINLFRQGDGDTITFDETGFSVGECRINGERENFAKYLTRIEADTRLPLVANYSGAMVNVSFQAVKPEEGVVDLYAPVFSGVEYRIAAPVGDYVTEFSRLLPSGLDTAFSCNCILNFLYSELEGKVTAGMAGPVTFGEIAYQLLNQTLVYLEIRSA
ncbi:MAG: hypothetical protein EA427_09295 [Spirochaetaceae bacterium]|nr:MAG: hypothetical protein EA427_09295 [Spirochaetaceae bacterium]